MTKQEYIEVENLLKKAGSRLDAMAPAEKTILYSVLKKKANKILAEIQKTKDVQEDILKAKEDRLDKANEFDENYLGLVGPAGGFVGTIIGGMIGAEESFEGLIAGGLLGGFLGAIIIALIILPTVQFKPLKSLIENVRSYFNEKEREKLEELAGKIEQIVGEKEEGQDIV